MRVSADFYGGSIAVLGITPGNDVELAIRPVPVPGFGQWSYFSIASGPEEVRRLVIPTRSKPWYPASAVQWCSYFHFFVLALQPTLIH